MFGLTCGGLTCGFSSFFLWFVLPIGFVLEAEFCVFDAKIVLTGGLS